MQLEKSSSAIAENVRLLWASFGQKWERIFCSLNQSSTTVM